MTPQWLTILAWIALGIAFACAVLIVADIFVLGYRQRMAIMEAVWPVTALYFGPVAVWMYLRYGRPNSAKWLARNHRDAPPEKPTWATTALGVSHCGAGCTLGDIVAATAIFVLGLEILGRAFWPEIIGDYVAALALGILFQYFAIAPMRGLGVRDGLVSAAKADVLSLTAFEVGLFGWMALMAFVFFPAHPLNPADPAYWFLMQIGMIIGFGTAWPANVWLIRRGIKEAM
jgi:hypothetical protein